MPLVIIAEAAALALSLSLDAFTAGFAYGSRRIKIPMQSVQIINIVCGLITGLALCAGAVLKDCLPRRAAAVIAFGILFSIGLCRLLDGVIKSVIEKHSGFNKELRFSMFNVKFILNLYANPEAADVDASQVISPMEAAALALSLSLDGIAVGFGAALADINGAAVFLWSLVMNAAAIMLGRYAGERLAKGLPFNVSWLGGAALIALAVARLL